MMWNNLIILTVVLTSSVSARKGFGPGDQDYGYVTVREKAHMFWWLFHTTAAVERSTDRPLILWLQGGPGASSTGIGNFEIMGPLDKDLKPRNTTWVNDFNVLYVDNPVGVGFSYVEDDQLLVENNMEIAKDLVALLKGFYNELPQFKTTPLYVFGESYGGKMAVDFVELLIKEVALGTIQSNISGVAMGDSWIHPVHAALSYGPYLYGIGLVDENGSKAIFNQAMECKRAFDEGRYEDSTKEYGNTQGMVRSMTGGIDFYNVLKKVTKENMISFNKLVKLVAMEVEDIDSLMNGPVKEALGIPKLVIWSYENSDVHNKLEKDFMKPVTDTVERLLNDTSIKVIVYNGNLDLIVSTPGQMAWVRELCWPQRSEYAHAPRNPIWVDNTMEGYEKTVGMFTFFWINNAGHMVPADNPAGARAMLKIFTGF